MLNYTRKSYFLFLTILFVSIVDLAILRWYFPLTEGWWETYAWLMSSGQSLYSDIWVSHPPLHILLMRAQMFFVGHDFLALRLLGVVTHGITVTLLYLLLERLTTPLAAFCGALISTFLIIYPNNVYIVRDYHTTVELFEVLALLSSTPVLIQSRLNAKPSFHFSQTAIVGILGAGFACGALLLVKQNIGVFFTASLCLAIFLRALDGRRLHGLPSALLAMTYFFLAFIVLPVLVTIWDSGNWLSVYFNNRSKGSLGLVLTRFLVDEESRKIFLGTLIGIVMFARCPMIEAKLILIANQFKILGVSHALFTPLAIRALFFIIPSYYLKLMPLSWIFSLSLAWVVYRAVHARSELVTLNAEWYEFGWLPLVGLAYCGTHTAGYNFVSMQLILALMVADLADHYSKRLPTFRIERHVVLGAFGLTLIVISLKLYGPIYNWWGLRGEGISHAKYSIPFNELRGFKVDIKTAQIFNKLAEYKSTLSDKDTIFSYPSIPIAYLLLNKKPIIKLPTLWFDVSDQSQLEEVVKGLDETNPSIIFWLKPADFVYNGHSNLRRLPSLISGVDNWIYENIASGKYHIESVLSLPCSPSWKNSNPDIREPIKCKIFVSRSDLNCNQVQSMMGVTETSCSGDKNLQRGSVLNVTFTNQYYQDRNIGLIGFPYSTNDEFSFIVLKKNIAMQ